ncbi:MAG TPA: hypothetical protein VMV84_00680 [Dehalococcoidales bacterium]|nr:hypothetical protein [Dehalococcoidales bacterium]
MSASRVIKIITTIGFILITLAMVVIYNSPATGYEVSIYSSTPLLVWVCLAISITCGIGIVVHQAYRKEAGKNLWVLGLALILLSNAIILSLHILRGYALWDASGDAGSHLGHIMWGPMATGHLNPTNFYPIAHTYIAQLSLVTGLNPVVWHQWIPVLFALLQIVFIYFVAKSVLANRWQVMLASIAGTTLIYGWYLHLAPNALANMLFPLGLYLLIRSFTPGSVSWKILFVIILFLFPPFHPIAAFALFIVLATIWLAEKLLYLRKGATVAAPVFQFNLPLTLLLLVWIITWVSSFYIWEGTIRNLQTLVTEGAPTPIESLIATVGPGTQHTYSVAAQFFRHYTGIIIYIILALAAFPILWKRIRNNEDQTGLVALYGPMMTIAAFIVACYFLNLGFGPTRVLVYITILCTIFVGFTLFELMERMTYHNNWWSRIVPVVLIILFLSVSISNIAKVYTSMYVLKANAQTTYSAIAGFDHLLHHKDPELAIAGFYITPSRYATMLLSPEEAKQHKIRSTEEHHLLFHFGYDKYPRIGQSYDEDEYRVITKLDRILCVEIKPELAELWYLPEDFVRLENDPSIDKLYANGEFDYWYVHAEASSSS